MGPVVERSRAEKRATQPEDGVRAEGTGAERACPVKGQCAGSKGFVMGTCVCVCIQGMTALS